jgi:protein-tyrosine phosphatase
VILTRDFEDRALDADCVGSRLWVGSVPTELVCQHFEVVVLAAMEFQHLELACETVRVPLDDDGYPSGDDRRRALEAARVVHRHREEGRRVLVTCAQGKNRSALIAALALMLEGSDATTAIAKVRDGRKLPMGLKALENDGFVQFLHEVGKNRRLLHF